MRSYGKVGLAGLVAMLISAAVWLGTARVWAQDGDWEMVRAEYGTRARHVDVTEQVRRLMWGGRGTGRAPVTSQTMGGDPAPGADKSLHIWGRNWRNEEREFDFQEGGWIDVRAFHVQEVRFAENRAPEYRRDRDDDDCWCREDREGRWRDERGLRILKAYYGVGGRTANVTEIVRRFVENDRLRVRVEDNELGGDPAHGELKVLIVIFRYNGKESAMSVKQGNTMQFP
jgi:hypothetical protein